MPSTFRAVLESIARAEAPEARSRFAEAAAARGLKPSDEAIDLAALLACAYPAMARTVTARPDDVIAIARGTKQARDVRAYRRAGLALIGDMTDETAVRHGLRVFAERERLRVAARELLPHAGSDIDVTARELSDLADVCLELALAEALAWADTRFGIPTTSSGERCGFVVLGMGKLGGRELNAGSDVDLLLLYATDDGDVVKEGKPTDTTLHEYFTRASQRFTATLSEVTDEGFVWRVDLRLRPEGARGPARELARRRGAVLRDVGPDVGARGAGAREAGGRRPAPRARGPPSALPVRLAARGQPRGGRRDDRPHRPRPRRGPGRPRARLEARRWGHPRGGVLRPVPPAHLGGPRAERPLLQHARRATKAPRPRPGDRPRRAGDGRRLPHPAPPRAPRAVRAGVADARPPGAGGPAARSYRQVGGVRRRARAGTRRRQDAPPRGLPLRVALARGAIGRARGAGGARPTLVRPRRGRRVGGASVALRRRGPASARRRRPTSRATSSRSPAARTTPSARRRATSSPTSRPCSSRPSPTPRIPSRRRA